MPLLSISALSKSYGADEILSGLDLVVQKGDRIGIIGPNGCGKSTLFRLIVGAEAPDSGGIAISRDVRLGHLPQDPGLDPKKTAAEEALFALGHLATAESELRDLEERLASSPPQDELESLVHRHGHVLEVFERGGGYAREPRAREVLAGVGLPPDRHDQPTSTLSGGEKCRVALARVLLSDADLLLLDEPTNHLDVEGTEWLEDELIQRSRAVLVISHDRRFLDRVTTQTLAFTALGPRLYPGGFSKTVGLRRDEAERLRVEVQKQRDFVRKEREFIRRHLGSQRSREAKGRRKRLERLELLELPPSESGTMNLDLSPQRRAGIVPLSTEDLAGGHPGRVLWKSLDLTLEPGERLGIVGKNGSGKSTLLKTLAGRLSPLSGAVDIGRNVDLGYFDQEQRLAPDLTVEETVRKSRPLWTDFEARSFLARILFFDDDIESEVGSLSGGERSRLALGLLILERPNMLFLDEPTNHLDIPARQVLEELLLEFSGTLIVVSHDRHFLDRVTQRTLWIDETGIFLFPGPFSDARERRRAAATKAAPEPRPVARERKPPPPAKKRRRPLATIEADIFTLEEEKKRLFSELERPEVYSDGAAVKERQERLLAMEVALAALYSEWESHGDQGPS